MSFTLQLISLVKFKYAAKLGFQHAVVIGPEEILNKTVQVKTCNQKQAEVVMSELVS